MNTKKWLAVGSCVTALGLFSACSDDESSPITPPVVNSSSAIAPNSSDATPNSSADVGGSSSSNTTPAPTSSSDAEGVVDSSFTNMGVSEIMYNAPGGSALEWVEVYIKKGPDITDMQLSNLRLDGAVAFNFPTGSLKNGEYVIVTNDVALFNQTYAGKLPAGCKVYGPWDKDSKTGTVAKLVNEGDVVEVKLKGEGDVSAAFSSQPPWPSLADGKGRTLVYRGTGNEADPNSWGASAVENGSPCAGGDKVLDASTVRLNEIKPYSLGVTDGWIELYNYGTAPVDIKGWELESKLKGKKWTIGGANTVVPANGYLLLEATADVFGDGLFLSDNGDEIYLFEAAAGVRTGKETSLLISAGKQSSGIVEVAGGSVAQGAMATETPGAANSALKAGPIFISEIHYHENESDLNDLEFLELVNKGTTPVTLAENVNNVPQGWKIEGVNMEFAATDVIAAGGKMVLFNDSLKAKESLLRVRYSIDESVPIRFYAGKLSNRGETVAVKKPYSFVTREDNTKQWYYEISDATLYSDRWPGLTEADGKGKSLNRKDFTTTGYGSAVWSASAPTPGK
ncbi:lamin tail domain-containing protein [Fibrobacter sp. UBA4297]|uniref:lamin tail domain-containing protein n=1 Tax=Fibrobacter sp. UBA4297 TaxID=1946536 RepID=UPI0025C19A74|nr:lamin tail domain-containing protein [Fibrobacter sp. UBA4297]